MYFCSGKPMQFCSGVDTFNTSDSGVESKEFANWVCTSRSEDLSHAGGWSLVWSDNKYKMSKQDCSRESGSFYLSNEFKLEMKTVAKPIVDAWLACIRLQADSKQSLASLKYTDDPTKFAIYFLI